MFTTCPASWCNTSPSMKVNMSFVVCFLVCDKMAECLNLLQLYFHQFRAEISNRPNGRCDCHSSGRFTLTALSQGKKASETRQTEQQRNWKCSEFNRAAAASAFFYWNSPISSLLYFFLLSYDGFNRLPKKWSAWGLLVLSICERRSWLSCVCYRL